jgi:hypothetical protein
MAKGGKPVAIRKSNFSAQCLLMKHAWILELLMLCSALATIRQKLVVSGKQAHIE